MGFYVYKFVDYRFFEDNLQYRSVITLPFIKNNVTFQSDLFAFFVSFWKFNVTDFLQK